MSLDEDLEDAAAAGSPASPGLRRARAWLSRAVEPGTIDFWRYVDDVGPVEAVRRIRSGRAPDRIKSLVGARAAAAPGCSSPRTTSGRRCRCTP
jgi:DNA processing protein